MYKNSSFNVAILLSTYNGSKYLVELLDSLLNQSLIGFNIYITDDFSSDATVSIINNYAKLYNNIHFIQIENSRRGSFYNFMNLLHYVNADYYLFSDQDDVWLKDKAKILVERLIYLENIFGQIPILVHSDLKVVDENLNIINNSFNTYSNINQKVLKSNKYFYLVTNSVVGCSMGINKFVKNKCFPINPYAEMHDSWIALSTIFSNGIIDFIPDKLILYRQHGRNVIGAKKSFGLKYYQNKIYNIFKIFSGYSSKIKLAKSLDNKFNIFKFIYYKLIYIIAR